MPPTAMWGTCPWAGYARSTGVQPVFSLSVFLLGPLVQLSGTFNSPSCLPVKNDLPEKPPCSVLQDFFFFERLSEEPSTVNSVCTA